MKPLTAFLAFAAVLSACGTSGGQKAASSAWGKAARGLQSRIILNGRSFRQFEPIEATVEVRNASDEPVRYDPRPVHWARESGIPRFNIADAQGNAPPCIAASAAVPAGPGPYTYPSLRPGQSVCLPPCRLDASFYLRRPGRYRIAWQGARPAPADRANAPSQKPDAAPLPPSGIIVLDVLPALGGGPDRDLVGRLLKVLPKGWRVDGADLLADNAEPPGWTPGRGSRVGLFHSPSPGLLRNATVLTVFVMAEASRPVPQLGSNTRARHLGRGQLGHVYLCGDAPGRWTHAAHDITVALAVASPPPKPAGPDWGRMASRIFWACHTQARTAKALGDFCCGANLRRREGELLRIEYSRNLATASKAKPWAPKEPGRPYYEVVLSVRPTRVPGQPSPWDKIIEWDSAPGVKGQVWFRAVSDAVAFRDAMSAILEREVARALRSVK